MAREIFRYYKRRIPSRGENFDGYCAINQVYVELGLPIREGPAVLNGEIGEEIDPHASAWYLSETERKQRDFIPESDMTLNQALNKLASQRKRRPRPISQTSP